MRSANDDAEVTRLRDLIRGCPTQAKIAIAALATMEEFTTGSYFKATEMYRVYRSLAEAIDVDPLGQKRITDQLREYETLEIIDMKRTSDGASVRERRSPRSDDPRPGEIIVRPPALDT